MRKQRTIRNVSAKLIANFLSVAMGFISRKIFLQFIGIEYLGLNGLLTSLLSMLGLLELGIGSAIYFSLFKPLATSNTEEVKSIMKLYRTLYKYIGFAVFGIGILLIPIIPYIINTDISLISLRTIYLLFLLDSSLSYFLSYRRNIFSADQKDYVITNIDTWFQLIMFFIQLLVVIYTHNFIVYIIVRIILNLLKNIFVYRESNKVYHFLQDSSVKPLESHIKKTIITNIKALFIINLSSYIVFGTDNLLLSIFVNLSAVAIYSNYSLIFGMVNSIFSTFIISSKASVGNYLVNKNVEDAHNLFKNMFFLNFLLTSYTSVALLIISNDFIKFWLGEGYTWSVLLIGVLVFNNYSRQILNTLGVFKDAAGLYNPYRLFKYLALFEGLVNLVVSIFLAKFMGLGAIGIFLGTALSTLVSTYSMPHVVYKYIFSSNLKFFYKMYLKYLLLTLLYCIIGQVFYILFRTDSGLINIVLGLIVSFITPMGLSVLIFRKSEEFGYFKGLVLNYVHRRLIKE